MPAPTRKIAEKFFRTSKTWWLTSLAFCGFLLISKDGRAACSGPVLTIDQHVSIKWRSAVSALQQQVLSDDAVDRCAAINLIGVRESLLVEVVLPDGRSTTRRVNQPDDLVETVKALVLMPLLPVDGSQKTQSTAGRSIEAQPTERGGDNRIENTNDKTVPKNDSQYDKKMDPFAENEPRRAQKPNPVRTKLEAGMGPDFRFSNADRFAPGALVMAQGVVDDWLIGVSFRSAFAQLLLPENPAGFHGRTVAAGVHLGRRIGMRSFDIDLLVGPMVVFEFEEIEREGRETHAHSTDVRLNGGVRYLTGKRVRFFAGLDIEGGSSKALDDNQYREQHLPQLPVWSFGLSCGILWGTQ